MGEGPESGKGRACIRWSGHVGALPEEGTSRQTGRGGSQPLSGEGGGIACVMILAQERVWHLPGVRWKPGWVACGEQSGRWEPGPDHAALRPQILLSVMKRHWRIVCRGVTWPFEQFENISSVKENMVGKGQGLNRDPVEAKVTREA